jgi:hypothetical protein
MESSPLVEKDVAEQILTQEFLLNKIMTGWCQIAIWKKHDSKKQLDKSLINP